MKESSTQLQTPIRSSLADWSTTPAPLPLTEPTGGDETLLLKKRPTPVEAP